MSLANLKFLFIGLLFTSCINQGEAQLSKSTPGDMSTENLSEDKIEIATLGGGCFWCTEAVYQNVEGVYSVESGYAGDTKEKADYKLVSSGMTKHAEVVQVKFDPTVISYEEILDIFWNTHDPTTLNRQGNDVGPQYRSIIFYHSDTQKAIADQSKTEVAPKVWNDPIVTEIEPFEAFYTAEAYHQDYYKNVGDRNPYCTYVITPKVKKFKKLFSEKLKKGDTEQ